MTLSLELEVLRLNFEELQKEQYFHQQLKMELEVKK